MSASFSVKNSLASEQVTTSKECLLHALSLAKWQLAVQKFELLDIVTIVWYNVKNILPGIFIEG